MKSVLSLRSYESFKGVSGIVRKWINDNSGPRFFSKIPWSNVTFYGETEGCLATARKYNAPQVLLNLLNLTRYKGTEVMLENLYLESAHRRNGLWTQ